MLDTALDYERALEEFARIAVPRLGDWCVIDVLEEDGSIARYAAAHANPDRYALVQALRERYPADPEAESGAALHDPDRSVTADRVGDRRDAPGRPDRPGRRARPAAARARIQIGNRRAAARARPHPRRARAGSGRRDDPPVRPRGPDLRGGPRPPRRARPRQLAPVDRAASDRGGAAAVARRARLHPRGCRRRGDGPGSRRQPDLRERRGRRDARLRERRRAAGRTGHGDHEPVRDLRRGRRPVPARTAARTDRAHGLQAGRRRRAIPGARDRRGALVGGQGDTDRGRPTARC